MNALTLSNALTAVDQMARATGPRQITDPAHADAGAVIHPDYGIADNKATSAFVTACAYLALLDADASPTWLDRAVAGADYLLHAQRPSGLIDLLSVNYDSSPDTGFTVQQLCTICELASQRQATGPAWQQLLGKLEIFIRRAVAGMRTGGFHTPNHRWVMVSAMVQARALFPDLDVAATVEAYLAEGYDIDDEGAYLERSVGVYDAVNNLSLLHIAEHWHSPDALDAVARSLDFDLHLLHADGTAETGLSRRQDYGTRTVPLGLAPCFLLYNRWRPTPHFEAAAQMLWSQATDRAPHILWIVYALAKGGDPAAADTALPDDFSRHYAHNGIWRVRRGLLSASFFRGVTRLLTLTHGAAELSSVKISQTYFGQYTGRFVSDSLQVEASRGVLRSEGVTNPRRPGYELPLGRPVPPDRWQELLAERSLRRVPPALSTLTVAEVKGGFDLRYQTLDGLDRVAAQMAFDFPPGGIWETEDTALQPAAGQVVFLKRGGGAMRYGNDVISIGPGAHAHAMWQMREAEPAPDHVRVVLTFLTPVDHAVQLRARRGAG